MDPSCIGDRILCLVAGQVRAKGVVTQVRAKGVVTQTSESRLLVDIRQASDATFTGRTLPLNHVIVIQKLQGFRLEWMCFASHARAVGFVVVALKTLLLRVRRRREKESLRLRRLHAPRSCKTCATLKPQKGFSTSQWQKSDGKRTCLECQEAARAALQKQNEEARQKAQDELRDAECAICYAERVLPENRAMFDCRHWVCKACASAMHLRSELKNCPHCRRTISMPHQYVGEVM